MKRLIDDTVSFGFSERTRFAAAPTSGVSPAPGKCTTEGVNRRPSASAIKHRKARVHHAHQGIGRTKINANNFAHRRNHHSA